jgi:hypothetical protein
MGNDSVVVAPDKFKGSLTATGAAETIATGRRQGRPGIDVPVAASLARSGDTAVVEMAEASGPRRLPGDRRGAGRRFHRRTRAHDIEPDLERCQREAATLLTSLARRFAGTTPLLGADPGQRPGSGGRSPATPATADSARPD